MASDTSDARYDKQKGSEQHMLDLPDGRKLGYAINGPRDATTIVIFFSGLMSVGTAHEVPVPCKDLSVQWIAPTLAGMGQTTSHDPSEPYVDMLIRDINGLLLHLYPTSAFTKLYLAGGSYGTVQAQMLYGASYDAFPSGRKIAGLMLLGGFSPYKHDTGYAKALGWQSWISVGPPSQLPFRILQRMFRSFMAGKMKTVDGAKVFLRQALFGKMGDDEKRRFAAYMESKGSSADEFVQRMAEGAVACCANWDGLMEVSDVVRSDWGFAPAELDEEHAKPPVLVAAGDEDDTGGANNAWLAANYKNAVEKKLPGGHIAVLYCMDELWQELIDMAGKAGTA